MEKNNDKYFVYVYRDARGNPVYVGQGKNINRSTQHLSESHNTKLKEWLNKNRETCVIEVIGPLGSKTLADQIETACISLIDNSSKSLLNNKHRGVTKFRFRPFGVPAKQVHRTLEFLEKKDFDNLTKTYGSLLFVKISGLNFENRGKGYDLINIPSDNDIKDRVIKSWQLNRCRDNWQDDVNKGPGLLVGVFGGPSQQIIVGAFEINKKLWAFQKDEPQTGAIKVPIIEKRGSKMIDEAGLRGKRISPDFNLRFGRNRADFFRIYTGKGLWETSSGKIKK